MQIQSALRVQIRSQANAVLFRAWCVAGVLDWRSQTTQHRNVPLNLSLIERDGNLFSAAFRPGELSAEPMQCAMEPLTDPCSTPTDLIAVNHPLGNNRMHDERRMVRHAVWFVAFRRRVILTVMGGRQPSGLSVLLSV